MTLFAIWCAYSIHWIRQRRQAIASGFVRVVDYPDELPTIAPALLWLFGEAGCEGIWINDRSEDRWKEAITLFPEGEVAGGLVEIKSEF